MMTSFFFFFGRVNCPFKLEQDRARRKTMRFKSSLADTVRQASAPAGRQSETRLDFCRQIK